MRFPAIKDRLVNFLDLLSGQRSTAPAPFVDGAIEQLGRQVRDPDYESVEQFSRAKDVGRFAAVPIIGLVAFFLIEPAGFIDAASRLMAPGVHFARPAPFQFLVEPGDAMVIKGDSLDFAVRTEGAEQPETSEMLSPIGSSLEMWRQKISR
jgi:hypothetical protein